MEENKANTAEKSLKLPFYAAYTPENPKQGMAKGSIIVNTDLKTNSATDIIPYWADENGILPDYTNLYKFEITGRCTIFEIDSNVIIPKEATKMLLFAYDYFSGETTEDYIEIELPKNRADISGSGDIITEFQVISDTHIVESGGWNDSYPRLLKDIVKVSPNSKGVFINGDVTNSGEDAQYEKFMELHSSVSKAPDYYIAVGNHEFYNGGVAAQKEIEARFVSFARLPDRTAPKSQHYDFWIKGYHYIILGNDGITPDLLSATFKDETLCWLRKKLAENRNEKRPTFVFLHQPIRDTVAGSFGEGAGLFTGVWGENAEKLTAVLKDFPEVILFSSHQHIELSHPRNIHKRNGRLPTILNTSSAAQATPIIRGVKNKISGSEGYYIYVYKDKVIARGRDFAKQKWLPSAQFYIEI